MPQFDNRFDAERSFIVADMPLWLRQCPRVKPLRPAPMIVIGGEDIDIVGDLGYHSPRDVRMTGEGYAGIRRGMPKSIPYCKRIRNDVISMFEH